MQVFATLVLEEKAFGIIACKQNPKVRLGSPPGTALVNKEPDSPSPTFPQANAPLISSALQQTTSFPQNCQESTG